MDSKVAPIAISALLCGIFASNAVHHTPEQLFQLLNVMGLMISVILFVGSVTSDIALHKHPRMVLGTKAYDLQPIFAPRVDGILLKIASWLLRNSLFGHLGRRFLVNLNGPDEMRCLANQALKQGYPIAFLPLRRNSPLQVTDEMAATATEAIQTGIPISYDTQQVVGVMDYYQAYSKGTVTPSEMMLRVFDAMEKFQCMNMFMEFSREKVLEQAEDSDERWKSKKPLSVFDGVPVAVKDTLDVKGFATFEGKPRVASDSASKEDDIMVRRLREAGATIVATTVMTEFGRCPLGYNSHYKGPFNPYDERCYTGGSSSGSVVSVMTGVVPIAISFDDGGSIRLPAALSGAFGLAPTYSRIPCSHVDSLVSGNTHAGVNTATTTDTALAYALLAQNESKHHYGQWYDGGKEGPPRPHLCNFANISDLSGVRIGVFWDYFNDCDDEINQRCKEALQQLESRGARIVEVTIPHLNALDLAHGFVVSMELSYITEREYHTRSDLEPATLIQLAVANSMSGVEFLAASQLRGWAMAYMEKLFAEEIDVFATPGIPVTAPPIPKGALDSGECNFPLMGEIMKYMFLVNLTGIPGMIVPIGYAGNRMPTSLQLMADHWNDALLLRLAHCIEKHIFRRQDPKHFAKISLAKG
ncbi:Glutamyl-tRNA(Gln) amidotransferase subunit A [Seminavis robusta]|uniref:Glutamyl-tRNA(Gln) amidotransferase subunit A n=1 Tax=Seminavis robusta TaxID=568900 RepID=A0A9N8DRF6_9STRA|nr:Glutamyl-tRNA(Gln) amidotransferase subunit A [Seminavis robusta]|eukprot:Sro235_g094770.1 Glutamyl-tRNA(Gln) amidotransferase subunit A (643) ;mRNA; f:59700-61719